MWRITTNGVDKIEASENITPEARARIITFNAPREWNYEIIVREWNYYEIIENKLWNYYERMKLFF